MCVCSLSCNLLVGHNLPSYSGAIIIFALVAVIIAAFIAAIMMSTTSFCLLNRNSFMCTLEEMLSDGAGITLNNNGKKAPHVSLMSPSFSKFE